MVKKVNILILIILTSGLVFVKAQKKSYDVESVYQLKVLFIYNFTKLIGWPESYQTSDFVIGVLGYSPIISELEKLAETKKADRQIIVVKRFKTVEEISKCHILFIPETQTYNLGAAINKLNGISALIIAESEGATKKGAAINFIEVNNKQRFELNESNAKKYGLVIGADLYKLAVSIK